MKTLLFDLYSAQPSGGSKFHGGGEYIKSIFKELAENYSQTIRIIVFYDDSRYLDDWLQELIKDRCIEYYFIRELSEIQNIFKKQSVDVFFSGLPEHYDVRWFPNSVKKIGTIHGLRKIEKPFDSCEINYYGGIKRIKAILRYFKNIIAARKIKEKYIYEQRNVIEFLDYIITVSKHSLYALKYYYPELDEKRVGVFYSPAKVNPCAGMDLQRVIRDKYILFIGGNRWMKNTYRGIQACDSLYNKGKLQGIHTVVVGQVPNTIVAKLKNSEMFIWKDYVETEELESLYRYCELFVYPSLNEGFGYPPLEAMKYGTTCIVSAVCSLPEICGNAVYYVNPYDVDEIANRILQALDNKISNKISMLQLEKIMHKQTEDLKNICKYLSCMG